MFFPSKKDISSALKHWTPIVVLLFLFILNWQMTNFQYVLGYIATALLIGLFLSRLWTWFGTGYKVNGELLKVRSGPFKRHIKIDTIKQISSANNSRLSGPALSTDQLQLIYGEHYDLICISPENKEDFVKALLTKNPHIQQN